MSFNPSRPARDAVLQPFATGALPGGLRGTAGTSISAVEQGEGSLRRTILYVTTPISVVTTPDTAALGDGILVYTFPAGQIIVHQVYGDCGLEINDATNVPDTPEVGLGTTLTTGAVATLGASAATDENIWGPHVVTGCDVGADTGDAIQLVSVKNLVIAGAGAHTVYFNCADTWANGAGTADVFLQQGRFVIDWTLLPIEGV